MNKIDLGGRCAVITGGAQGMGRALAERFLASGAARWLLRAIKFAPKRDAVPYQNLGRLYLRGDRAVDAFRVLAQCKVLFPENQATYELLAWVYVQQGFYDGKRPSNAPVGGVESVLKCRHERRTAGGGTEATDAS
jgi:hypothetical protein